MRPIPAIPEVLSQKRDWTVPSPEWEAWARETFIEGDGPLVNPDHAHLSAAVIGFLLTNAVKEKGGRRWAGSGGAYKPAGDGWTKAQAAQRMVEWFGVVPDFLITLDVTTFDSPRWICALVDHELRHCGVDTDDHGAPKYGPDGRPAWKTSPHYAELNEGDLARWGADATPGGKRIAMELSRPPLITDAMLEFDAEEAGSPS